MTVKKSKKFSSIEDEYNDAMATSDPTTESVDLEKLAKEAIKKFKSLG